MLRRLPRRSPAPVAMRYIIAKIAHVSERLIEEMTAVDESHCALAAIGYPAMIYEAFIDAVNSIER